MLDLTNLRKSSLKMSEFLSTLIFSSLKVSPEFLLTPVCSHNPSNLLPRRLQPPRRRLPTEVAVVDGAAVVVAVGAGVVVVATVEAGAEVAVGDVVVLVGAVAVVGAAVVDGAEDSRFRTECVMCVVSSRR